MLEDSHRNSEELSGKISSMSSDTCASFSRLSFEFLTSSPEQTAALKPHRSSDSLFHEIQLKTNLTFRDFSLVRQIGSGDIGRVYLCCLRAAAVEEGRLYAMKVFRVFSFSLVRQIGNGDIGMVYLYRLRATATVEEGRLYAMKVVDNGVLALKKKMQRAKKGKFEAFGSSVFV